jgi:hypothetical protein
MVQVAWGPLSWFTLWLADETKSGEIVDLTLSPDPRYCALLDLKRKLTFRIRGILEITVFSNNQCSVSFDHSRAYDWARQPEVWEPIFSACGDFDLYLALLGSEVLQMGDEKTATG